MSGTTYDEAVALLHNRRFEQALSIFLEVADGDAATPLLAYFTGLCYTHLGKYDEALLYLEEVTSADLDLVHLFQCKMILGYIYAITNRNRLAEMEFRGILAQGFESAKVFAALAHALFAQNKADESIECLEKALQLEPDNANALNSLGYVLAEQEKRLGMALVYCQKASAKDPANPAYLDSLGWVQHKCGNHREARAFLRKALDLAPRNLEIARHLRVVMEQLR